jgi:hypothetical protein
MIVPDHWAEARRHHRAGKRRITVRRFGWSTASPADATAMAEQRAQEALDRLIAGENLPRREPKVPYNGAEGVPIREEVVVRHGDDVITRNAYGARCLNSPDALFADVDFQPSTGLRPLLGTLAVLVLASTGIGVSAASWRLALILVAASVILCAPLAKILLKLATAAQGGAEALARRRLGRFLQRNPEWSVRVYRTPGGLRLLATHRPFDPGDPQVEAFFRAVATDPIYARMCRRQNCFRARLTAKPWRIGIASHLRPRPGIWPVAPSRMPLRTSWVAAYEARASQFASCRYVDTQGSGVVHHRIQSVVDLHDRESRCHDPAAKLA